MFFFFFFVVVGLGFGVWCVWCLMWRCFCIGFFVCVLFVRFFVIVWFFVGGWFVGLCGLVAVWFLAGFVGFCVWVLCGVCLVLCGC